MSAPWKFTDGTTIHLVTQKEFDALPDGTILRSIAGQTVTKGVDYIDNDTRGGYFAFGTVEEPSSGIET